MGDDSADLMTASFDFYRTKIGLNTRDYVSKMPDLSCNCGRQTERLFLSFYSNGGCFGNDKKRISKAKSE